MIKYFLTCLFVVFISAGCAKVKNLPQLLTLKGMMESGIATDAYVDEKERQFELLVTNFKENDLQGFSRAKDIIREYGEPIMIKDVLWRSVNLEQWLYRRPVKYSKTDRIYLYFDLDGNLVDKEYQEYVEPPEDENQEKIDSEENSG